MPRKPEEAREEADGQVKTPRRRTSISTSSSSPASDSSPNVTEAKPPASVGATTVDATEPGPTLPVTETPYGAEEEIRRRAYELYEQDGRQHGRDHDHWLRAEAEVLGGSNEVRVNDARASQARSNARAPRRSQKSA